MWMPRKQRLTLQKRIFRSYIAAEKTAEANVEHAKADLEQKKLDYDRYTALYAEKLVSKADFDAKKAAYDTDVATLNQSNAALVQAKAQTDLPAATWNAGRYTALQRRRVEQNGKYRAI